MNDNIAETFFLTEQIVKELDKIITENVRTNIRVNKTTLTYKSTYKGNVQQYLNNGNLLRIHGNIAVNMPERRLKLHYNILVDYLVDNRSGTVTYSYFLNYNNHIIVKQSGKEDITFTDNLLKIMSNTARANMLYPVLKYKDTREAIGGSYETRN